MPGHAAPDPLQLDFVPEGASRAHIITIRLRRALEEDIRRVLAAHSTLTIPEWRILSVLYQGKGAQAQKDIIAHTRIAQGQASRALFAMQNRGLLEAAQSTKDRRAWSYRLSAEGRALFEALIPQMRERQRRLEGAVSEQELAQFQDIAARIARATNEG